MKMLSMRMFKRSPGDKRISSKWEMRMLKRNPSPWEMRMFKKGGRSPWEMRMFKRNPRPWEMRMFKRNPSPWEMRMFKKGELDKAWNMRMFKRFNQEVCFSRNGLAQLLRCCFRSCRRSGTMTLVGN